MRTYCKFYSHPLISQKSYFRIISKVWKLVSSIKFLYFFLYIYNIYKFWSYKRHVYCLSLLFTDSWAPGYVCPQIGGPPTISPQLLWSHEEPCCPQLGETIQGSEEWFPVDFLTLFTFPTSLLTATYYLPSFSSPLARLMIAIPDVSRAKNIKWKPRLFFLSFSSGLTDHTFTERH